MPREYRTPPDSSVSESELLARANSLSGGSVLDLSRVDPTLFSKKSSGYYLLHARVTSPTLIEHLAILRELYNRSLRIPEHLMRMDAELVFVRGEWVLRGVNPRSADRRSLLARMLWYDHSDGEENFRSYSGTKIGTESTSRQVFGRYDYKRTYLISYRVP